MRKRAMVRVHHQKEQWGDTIRKSDGVRVDHEKKGDGVKVHHERKSDGVRVHYQKERLGESSPKEKAMACEFTMRKGAMG